MAFGSVDRRSIQLSYGRSACKGSARSAVSREWARGRRMPGWRDTPARAKLRGMDQGASRKRDVRLIVGAVGISALGDFLLWIPLTLHLQEMSDSGLAIAGLFLALWTPVVVLAPVAGLVVDRLEARAILLVASLAQMVVAAGLVLALDSVAAILVLAALLGTGFAFAQPAEFSLVPVIAGGERPDQGERPRGDRALRRHDRRPADRRRAGRLRRHGGGDARERGELRRGRSGRAVLTARRPPAVVPEGAEPERARDGIAYLFRDRTLALAMSVVFVTLLFMTASVTAEVFFLKEDLDVSDAVYGLVFGAWTVGMVVGALVVSRRVPRPALALGVLVAMLVQGAGLGLPTAWLVVPFGGRDVVHRRGGPRDEEHAGADADPGASARPPARARLRRLQRDAQRRRAGGARLRRPAGERDRRTHHARAGGRDLGGRGPRRPRALPAPAAVRRAGTRELISVSEALGERRTARARRHARVPRARERPAAGVRARRRR